MLHCEFIEYESKDYCSCLYLGDVEFVAVYYSDFCVTDNESSFSLVLHYSSFMKQKKN